MLHLHGGSTTGSSTTHRTLATHLAAAASATVHLLDDRLAPEHPYRAALGLVSPWRDLRSVRESTTAVTALGEGLAGHLRAR